VFVKIVNHSPHALPAYATEDSAGMDIRAWLSESITLGSLQRVLIHTGIHIQLPKGFEAQIRPRSGLAYKAGLTLMNSPGTIDADYTGEIKILLVNLSDAPYTIQDGERIAQMVIAPYTAVAWQSVTSLEDTARGEGGFGSTGKA
jgi:dUTP pyrophosphatase